MLVEHTLLTELQPQLQNYLPHEKENKSWLMVKIQTVGAAVPPPSQLPTPIQRSRKHIYLFIEHFSHSIGRPAFCVHHASPSWSSPTWQSLEYPSQAIPHGAASSFYDFWLCVHAHTGASGNTFVHVYLS